MWFSASDKKSGSELHCMDTGYTSTWQDAHIIGSANNNKGHAEPWKPYIREHRVYSFMHLDPSYMALRFCLIDALS